MLLFLEQSGILDPLSRELVIDRAIAIEQSAVAVDELKWVVLLVLMNRPGRESALSQMEDLIYGDPVYLH
jgi:Smg protein